MRRDPTLYHVTVVFNRNEKTKLKLPNYPETSVNMQLYQIVDGLINMADDARSGQAEISILVERANESKPS
jgi:hypothetical protein